ncbi:hypothetical protein AAVH_19867 [Aphelenchoides avenae]|nr:hypothetical protein AAVH_19867 [Aphelenchus avenae]
MATILDFAQVKKRVTNLVAVNELKKELTDLRTEFKWENTEHANAKSEAEKTNKQLVLVSAQRDQSDEKMVDLKNETRRLKESP